MFGGYVKVSEFLETWVVVSLGECQFTTILRLGQFYPGMEALAWYVDPNGIETRLRLGLHGVYVNSSISKVKMQ